MGQFLIEPWYRLATSFRRRRLEKGLDDEVAFHLAMREADAIGGSASIQVEIATVFRSR